MKKKILLPSIVNYDKSMEIVSKTFSESIYAFRLTLLLILKNDFQIPFPDELNRIENCLTKESISCYSFEFITGNDIGSVKLKCKILSDERMGFDLFILEDRGENCSPRIQWQQINPASYRRNVNFIFQKYFWRKVPKIAVIIKKYLKK